MEYTQLLKTKKELDLLIQGIDPQSFEYVGDDSILASRYNQKLLQTVSSILDKLIKLHCDIDTSDRRRKYSFYLDDEQKSRIIISSDAISISRFTYSINELVDSTVMKKLKATTITKWLCENEYLRVIECDDGSTTKIVTSVGQKVGINTAVKHNQKGQEYYVNLYSESAQRFIIAHLDEITAEYI